MSNINYKNSTAEEVEEEIDIDESIRVMGIHLEKAQRSLKNTIIVIPIVGAVTYAHYTGSIFVGGLPRWSGFIVLGVCLLQVLFSALKIGKLKTELSKLRPVTQ